MLESELFQRGPHHRTEVHSLVLCSFRLSCCYLIIGRPNATAVFTHEQRDCAVRCIKPDTSSLCSSLPQRYSHFSTIFLLLSLLRSGFKKDWMENSYIISISTKIKKKLERFWREAKIHSVMLSLLTASSIPTATPYIL